MNELSRNIICLLAENDCVILPGIGGFIAHYKSANYNTNNKEFVSPQRVIGFNRALTLNDGLMVQAYMERHGLNYPDASKLVDSEISKVRQQLNDCGKVHFESLGILVKTSDEAYSFETSASQAATPELFGLPNFGVATLPKAKEQIATETDEATTEYEEKEEENKTYNFSFRKSFIHKAVAIAAAIILFFAFTSPVNDNSMGTMQTSSMIGTFGISSKQETAKPMAKPVAMPTESKQEKTSAETSAIPTAAYTIVLASAVSKRNAEEFASSLNAQGYNDVEIIETKSMRRVVYSHFENESEARTALNKINDKDFAKEAWILKLKNQ